MQSKSEKDIPNEDQRDKGKKKIQEIMQETQGKQ